MVDHGDISDGLPQECISVKVTSLNPPDRLGVRSRGSMTDKPKGILCDHLVPEKLHTVVINFTVSNVILGAFVHHLTSGFVFNYPLKDLGPKVLKKCW